MKLQGVVMHVQVVTAPVAADAARSGSRAGGSSFSAAYVPPMIDFNRFQPDMLLFTLKPDSNNNRKNGNGFLFIVPRFAIGAITIVPMMCKFANCP